MPYRGVLELNTQVRRLSIVSALIRLLGHEALSEKILLSRLFRWSKLQEEEGADYRQATGKVTIKGIFKPAAARRYLSFAQAIGLIVKVSGAYRATRLGLVLYPFLDENSRTIALSIPGKLFFGYILLSYDSDILLTIVAQLLDKPQLKIVEYQREFREYHVNRLNHRIEASTDDRIRQALLERRTQILGWKKPQEYPEHIVPPRLNWLCDLGLVIDWKPAGKLQESTRRFRLTSAGERFFTQLPLLGQRDHEYDATPEWLQCSYFSHFAECIDIPSAQGLSAEDQDSLLSKYVDIAFHEFRREIAVQVPLLQVILHTVLNICLHENTAVDYDDVVTWLTSDRAVSPGNGYLRYLVSSASRENEAFVLLSHKAEIGTNE